MDGVEVFVGAGVLVGVVDFDGVDGEGWVVLDGDGFTVDGEGVEVDVGSWVVAVGAGALLEGAEPFVVGAGTVTDTVGAAGCLS